MSELALNYTETELEIPTSVFVNCPLHGDNFPLVRVSSYCTQCKNWQGFFKRDYQGTDVPFAKQFSIKCGLPVSRQLTEVIE